MFGHRYILIIASLYKNYLFLSGLLTKMKLRNLFVMLDGWHHGCTCAELELY